MGDGEARIIVLNGAPRSGKSSIAAALLARSPNWIADGVDADMAHTPAASLPGIGLRPGGERPELEAAIRDRYAALFDRIRSAWCAGQSVVVDLGLHHDYAGELHPLWDAAMKLPPAGTWLVGVRCDLGVIMERRSQSRSDVYLVATDGEVPLPVRRWQEAVHDPGTYDLEVDTSTTSAELCAEQVLAAIGSSRPTALRAVGQRSRPKG